MPTVVAGRVVQGLGAGALPAVIYVVIGRAYPARLRPRMFAVLSTAWVVPSLVGPGVSGWVAEHLTWRLVFLGILPILAVAVPMTLPGLRTLELVTSGDRGAGSVRRAMRLALGAALVLGGLGRPSWLGVPVAVTGAAVAVPAFVGLVPAGTVRAAPGPPAAVAFRGLLTFAFFGADAYLPLMLTSVRDRSALFAGVALTIAGLVWTLGSWTQARRAMSWTMRRLARTGITLVACGIVGVALAIPEATPAAAAWGAWAVAGFGMGLSYSMSSLVVLGEAPPDAVGAATASVQLADVLGMALGTGLGGAIVATGEAADWTRGTSIAVVVAASRLPARFAGAAFSAPASASP